MSRNDSVDPFGVPMKSQRVAAPGATSRSCLAASSAVFSPLATSSRTATAALSSSGALARYATTSPSAVYVPLRMVPSPPQTGHPETRTFLNVALPPVGPTEIGDGKTVPHEPQTAGIGGTERPYLGVRGQDAALRSCPEVITVDRAKCPGTAGFGAVTPKPTRPRAWHRRVTFDAVRTLLDTYVVPAARAARVRGSLTALLGAPNHQQGAP